MSQDSTSPAARAEKPRWRGLAQLALILLVIVGALYLARAPVRVEQGPPVAAAQAVPAVAIVKPEAGGHVITAELTGTVRLERQVRVRSEAEGRVIWVSPHFTEGGTIAANRPFIRIDPREADLAIEAARMSVAEAEAELAIEGARAEEAHRAFERDHPGADLPDRLRRPPAVARAEARLGKARAEQALAELRRARTEIALPFDVHVVASEVEVGEIVGPAATAGKSATLGVVYRREALQLRVPIDPAELARLAPAIGRSARVETASGTYSAAVVRVSSIVSPKTRLAALFLRFDQPPPPGALPPPGSFARVRIFGPERENVYLLPDSAARERDAVWVVRNGMLEPASPKTVARTAAGWVVEAFDAGDGVAVGTLSGAAPGLKVTPVPAPSDQ